MASNPSMAAINVTQNVHLTNHVVPLLRTWLKKGVSESNLRSSARITDLTKLSGGLKSPLVADVELSLRVIVKQGTDELISHQTMMSSVNAQVPDLRARIPGLQDAVFPEVMIVVKAVDLPAPSNHLMVQQSLVSYDSVNDLLFESGSPRVIQAVRNGMNALEAIHSITTRPGRLVACLPQTRDPFTRRITEKLKQLRPAVKWLNDGWKLPLLIDDVLLPPLDETLRQLETWQKRRVHDLQLRLIHGDPHLSNLMARPRGVNMSVRWIDPNPTLGFSDPAYDWGKMLHFAETVGWAKHNPKHAKVEARKATDRITVTTSLFGVSKTREVLRRKIEDTIRARALKALDGPTGGAGALDVAICSAHLGLATIAPTDSTLHGSAERVRQSYVLARALAALARWNTQFLANQRRTL